MRNTLGALGALIAAVIMGYLCGCNVVEMLTEGATVHQGGITAGVGVLCIYNVAVAAGISIRAEKVPS